MDTVMDIVMAKADVVILTGAGISAESGIQTFRGSDGLWENHAITDVASIEGYHANPNLVQRFYNDRRRQLITADIQPNKAHYALAEWGAILGERLLLVTQNVDNLHERAGSKNVVHMHGELLKMRCENSGEVFSITGDIRCDDCCRCCGKEGSLRPHIVWFGEMPLEMETIDQALSTCQLFVAIGTSGNVYPAAGFVQQAKYYGAKTVEINLEPSAVNSEFDECYYGLASEQVPVFVASHL